MASSLNKTFTIINFNPGLGGNFVKFLLSLDENVYPLIPKEYENQKISKQNIFSFENLNKDDWAFWHLQFDRLDITMHQKLMKFSHKNNTMYNHFVYQTHPFVFYTFNHGFNKKIIEILPHFKNIKTINHIYIEVGKIFFSKIVEWGKTIGQDIEDHEFFNRKYKEEYNPYVINFDNFILGEETFLLEYTKLCNYFNFPIYIKEVSELYKDWYKERKFADFINQ